MSEHVAVIDDGAIRVITMQRLDKKNAITPDMYRAMTDAVDSASDAPDVRCLLISGGTGVFTAGNDLADFRGGGISSDAPAAGAALEFLRSLARSSKPVVAAVDGMAVGIGTTLLFHCDYVVASEAATFTAPFIRLGIVPEGASTLLVPRAIGHQRAFALLVMGRTLSAEDARLAGFVNVVVPPGSAETEARAVAGAISALPPEAVAISRALLKPPIDEVIDRIDYEGQLFAERLQSAEAIAAFEAFFARKKP
jgi:enoyl-CoA hydratase/carnithine racemase